MSVSYVSNVAFVQGFSKVANHWVVCPASRRSPSRRRCSGRPVVSIQTAHAERVRASKVRQRLGRQQRVLLSRFRFEVKHCQLLSKFYARHWQVVPDNYILYDTRDHEDYSNLHGQLVSVSKMRDYKFMCEFPALMDKIKCFMVECNPQMEEDKEWDMDDLSVEVNNIADLTDCMKSCVLFEFRSI